MVYETDPLVDPRWPEFLSRNSRASVFHTREWLETLFSTYGHRPMVLTTSGPDNELANGLVFCRVKSWITRPRLVSLPFSDHCEPLAGNSQDREQLFSELERQSGNGDCRYIEIRPSSPLPSYWMGTGSDWLPTQIFCLHRLDLRPGANDVFRHFHRDCVQRRIRHAEKQRIDITEGRGPAMVEDFYRLMVQTRRRHGLPPQPIAWFKNLVHHMGEAATIRCANKDGQPIAAILTLQHGKSLYYKYGASVAQFHRLGAMPYLFWRTIQDAIKQGLEELDLGRSDCDNLGLIAFKERWAATRTMISYMRFPAGTSRGFQSPGWTRSLTRTACRHAPEKCLTSIGTLSYRHID